MSDILFLRHAPPNIMNELTTITSITPAAAKIAERVKQIKSSIMSSSIELGRLLRVVKEHNFHQEYGYSNFGDWVEQGSGADLSRRQAAYLIQIVERSEALGIGDDKLNKLCLSSAKEIFSLPETVPDEQVIALVEAGATQPLSEVKKQTQRLKNVTKTHRNLLFDKDAAENVWDPAIERVRAAHGGYGHEDISESNAAILLAAEYLAQPIDEEQVTDIQEGEFEDIHVD